MTNGSSSGPFLLAASRRNVADEARVIHHACTPFVGEITQYAGDGSSLVHQAHFQGAYEPSLRNLADEAPVSFILPGLGLPLRPCMWKMGPASFTMPVFRMPLAPAPTMKDEFSHVPQASPQDAYDTCLGHGRRWAQIWNQGIDIRM